MTEENFQNAEDGITEFTYRIPTDKLALAVEAFCGAYKYEPKVRDEADQEIDNPISPRQFMLNKINDFVNETTVAYFSNKARAELQAQLDAQAEALKMTLEVK